MRRFGALVLAVILIISLWPRAAFLATGPESLVRIIPDDAFYYFQIARNIVAGNGSTLDGTYPSNGYHPLWMVLLLPVAGVAQDPLLLIRLAVGLGILLNLVSASLVYLVLSRVTPRWWIPIVGVGVYVFNTRSMWCSVNGLETSVSSLMFVASLYVVLIMDAGARKPRAFEWSLGLLLGLLFLARTDNAFYVIGFLLLATFHAPRSRRLGRGLILIGSVAVVAAPWVLWNWIAFGSPVQDSGWAIPYRIHQSYLLEGHTTSQMMQEGMRGFWYFISSALYHHLSVSRATYLAAVLCSIVILVVRWRDRALENRPEVHRLASILLALFVGSLLLIFAHTSIRWYPRPWYFDQITLLSALLFGLGLAVLDIEQTLPRIVQRLFPAVKVENGIIRSLVLAAVVLIAALALTDAARENTRFLESGLYLHQMETLDAAYWLKDNVDDDERVVAFNAGILAFFSGKQVVNLDGVINSAAYAAVRNKDLMGFVHRSAARYYLDYDPVMMQRYLPFLGEMQNQVKLSPVAEIDRPEIDWNGCQITVYQLNWLQ